MFLVALGPLGSLGFRAYGSGLGALVYGLGFKVFSAFMFLGGFRVLGL